MQVKGKKAKSKTPRDLVAKPQWGRVASQNATEQRRITVAGTLTTLAGGFVGFLINTALMRTGNEWASYAARYAQYRLLGVRVHITDTPAASQPSGSVVLATDESGSLPAPVSALVNWQAGKPRVYNLDQTSTRPITYEARAVNLDQLNYTAVGVSATTLQILIAINGPATAAVAQYYAEWCVEFKSIQ